MEIVGDSHGPLDGSIISIQTDFDDAVTQPSLTLAFENGKVTSTWENPDDNEYEVVIDNYNFEELSTTSFKITRKRVMF